MSSTGYVPIREVQYLEETLRGLTNAIVALGGVVVGDEEEETTPVLVTTPQAHGALADGVNDDTVAIQAAIDAIGASGGGQVYFPPGTYRIATQYTNDLGFLWALNISYDNVQLVGTGNATRLFLDLSDNTAMVVIAGMCKAARNAGNVNNWDRYYPFTGTLPAPAYDLTGTVAKGATTVTLNTAAEASNFAVGDYVIIRTGATTNAATTVDGEINTVKAVNAGTGEITLDVPTVKSYAQEHYITGSSGISAVGGGGTAVPYKLLNVNDRILKNVRVSNLMIETRANRHAIIGGFTDRSIFENIDGYFRGGQSFMSYGGTRGQRVRHCRLIHKNIITNWVYCVTMDSCSSDGHWFDISSMTDAGVVFLHLHEGCARCTARDITLRGPEVSGDFNSISIRARAYDHTIENIKIVGGGSSNAIYVDQYGTGGGRISKCQVENSLLTNAIAVNATGWRVEDIISSKPFSLVEPAFGLMGNGSPESSVVAPKGSVYTRLDGSLSTTIYIKESGTGSTGWQSAQTSVGYSVPGLDPLLSARGMLGETFLPSHFWNSGFVPTSTAIIGGLVYLPGEITITNLLTSVVVAGAGTAPTLIKLGIYSGGGSLLAETANVASDSMWTSVGQKEVALSSTWDVPAPGAYYFAFLINGTFTVTALQLARPLLAALSSSQAGKVQVGSGLRLWAVATGGHTDLDSSITWGDGGVLLPYIGAS